MGKPGYTHVILHPAPSWLDMINSFVRNTQMFSPVHPVKVQTTKEWRAEKKAEEASGYRPKILVPFFFCDLCSIGIGPNHAEQELYLFHVVDRTIFVKNNTERYFADAWLLVCGGCARWHHTPRGTAPRDHLVIVPEDYLTRKLLDADGKGIHRAVNMSNPDEIARVRLALKYAVQQAKQKAAGAAVRRVEKRPSRPTRPMKVHLQAAPLFQHPSMAMEPHSATQQMRALAGSLMTRTQTQIVERTQQYESVPG